MKKITAMLLALAMCFAMLTACGGSKPAEAPAEKSAEASSAAEGSAEAPAEDGALTVADGILTMGTNAAFPPYEFKDENQEIVGIDAEIAGALAEKLGLTLEIVDMDFGSIVTSVQTGKIDVGVAGMTVTEDRLQNVNFTDSYATGIQVVIVKEDSDITSVDDISAKIEAGEDVLIGCQDATTGYIYASDTPDKGGFDNGNNNVLSYPNGATAVQQLTQGKVDCVIIDREPAKNFVAANEGLKILESEYVVEDYAIAVNKENTALLDALNSAMAELTEDGTIQSILDKYIPAE